MKKMSLLLFTVSVLSVACDKEPLVPDNNLPGNPTDPSDTTQIYPYTAEIIPSAVTDYDGNIYDAVKIGEQIWMASNLRTTHYADGESIPLGDTLGYDMAYRYFLIDDSWIEKYGYLYNWPAVMHNSLSNIAKPSDVQGICPNGWHVPSDTEWTELENYVRNNCSNNVAQALKSPEEWISGDHEHSNISGFGALPASQYSWSGAQYNYGDDYGEFINYDELLIGGAAFFWSATETNNLSAYSRFIADDVYREHADKFAGNSVRCLRD